ncbi:MAG: condensation domain-containing protein, partial [Pyrinomonadaceae bacterium]
MSGIADIYELTPMQQGMLYHCLGATASQRVHFVQISYTWRGPMDAAAFAGAWRQIVERHAVLRTFFMWEGLEKPVQVVRREVVLPVETRDLRGFPAQARLAALDEYLADDRRRGFNLEEAPLLRIAVFRLAEETYRVVWSFHHLLFEGWSASMIHAELEVIYEALRGGRTAQLPPPRPYRDYIVWLQQTDLAPAESYWRAALAGFTAPTPLGVDRLPAPVASIAGEDIAGENIADEDIADEDIAGEDIADKDYAPGEEHVRLAAGTYAALQAFARRHRLTPNIVAQGAWSLLLSLYSGEPDVVFGTVVSGRQAAPQGAETMIGLFINTLPMRVLVERDIPLLEWLRGLQSRQLEMLQYEYSSLVDVQGWSEVGRGTPLFESLFVFENWIGDASRGDRRASFEIGDFDQFDGGPGYPLAIVFEPGRDCQLKAIYDRARFAPTTIARTLAHLLTLLESFTRDADRPLCELSPLTEAERHGLLVEWNDTGIAFPRGGLSDLFARQASARRDAVAVVCDDEHLTYHELDARANQVARALKSFGVGPETRIGLCVERSTAMLVGLLGIVKAGGAYVPLDPSYPLDRLAFMVEDAQLPVIVTRSTEAERLPAFWGQVLCLDTDADLIEGQRRDEPPRAAVGPDNIAYVSFTSGSTGQPKGVEVRHAGVARLVEGAGFATLDERQRLLHLSPLAFDASTLEVWGALL